MSRRYFAACTLGLEEVLQNELVALGATDCEPGRGGVRFAGEARIGTAACLWLRSAIRVQEEITSDDVREESHLYELVRAVRWERFIGCDDTLAVDVALRDSFLTHSRYAAQLVKDAIVDRFRDREGRRPSVDTASPVLPVFVHLAQDRATLYVDLAGESLHKRGYHDVQVKSPLNESIAAGLLLASDWDRRSVLCDPMCGSATFLVEAAWLAGDRAPGLRRRFAFEKWQDHDAAAWRALVDDAKARAVRGAASIPPLEGADRHGGAIAIARRSARTASVDRHIRLVESDVAQWVPGHAPSFCVVNPPYGERLGEGEDLVESWRALGDFFRRWPGLVAWVLSGNPELTRHLRLSTSRKLPVRNGPIDCRFLRYTIDADREPGAPPVKKKLPGS